MSVPTRILLRLLGFALLLLGLAGIVLLFVQGPSEIADWMGKRCANRTSWRNQQCDVGDVVEPLLVVPLLILVGGVMALALRPESKGPMTLDLSRFRRG